MPLVSTPFVFTPNTTILSAQVNADFSALASAINGGIDNANVGALGFYASQIIPLTPTEATFGGTQTYSFPESISVGVDVMAPGGFFTGPSTGGASSFTQAGATVFGPVRVQRSGGISLATVPPVYTALGVDYGGGVHIVAGQAVIRVANGANLGTAVISLVGDGVFISTPIVTATLVSLPQAPAGWTGGTNLTAIIPGPPYNVLTIRAFTTAGSASSGVSLAANWMAIGV